MEKSPSPVYGARLELVYGLIAHRGFESLLLRHVGTSYARSDFYFYKNQSPAPLFLLSAKNHAWLTCSVINPS